MLISFNRACPPNEASSGRNHKIIDYETNRWFGLGLTRLEDLKTASQSVRTISDNEAAFLAQAVKAEKEGRLLNAAIYYHAAQFFVPGDIPSQMHLYDKFYECFYKALPAGTYNKHQVPYQGTFLPVVSLSPKNEIDRGTILFHGGFDSVVEEFYPIREYFRKLGYKVYYFEGPDQDYTLRKNDLPLDHD